MAMCGQKASRITGRCSRSLCRLSPVELPVTSSRILVVDDEPQLRRTLRSTLSALGFTVADAETGEAALEKLREEKFDLLLLDINMPGLSGIETCRAVRARSDISVLMLTVPRSCGGQDPGLGCWRRWI